MTWPDFALARQLLNEEFVGAPMREYQRSKAAEEEAAAKAVRDALTKR
jgi:hypothetical protein